MNGPVSSAHTSAPCYGAAADGTAIRGREEKEEKGLGEMARR